MAKDAVSVTLSDAVSLKPPPSVAVTVIEYVPGLAYVWELGLPDDGVVPSPQSIVVLAIEPAESVQLLVAVTAKGVVLLLICRVGGRQVGAPGGGTTAMLNAWVAIAPVASLTCTVKLNDVPAVVGVPEITPDEFKFVPGATGKLPEASDHV